MCVCRSPTTPQGLCLALCVDQIFAAAFAGPVWRTLRFGCSGLDKNTASEIVSELQGLKQNGTAVLVISHQKPSVAAPPSPPPSPPASLAHTMGSKHGLCACVTALLPSRALHGTAAAWSNQACCLGCNTCLQRPASIKLARTIMKQL